MFSCDVWTREIRVLGRHTLVETDHSPLEQIFKKKIAEAPARLTVAQMHEV